MPDPPPPRARLLEARNLLGLTQAQAAVRLGVSRQTINSIERGKFEPTLKLAHGLAQLYGATIEELFFDELPARGARRRRSGSDRAQPP
ncbi:helix-turn-helix transcriptional regulator [Zhihengliuella salsuginis]|uniref:HTH cro/C1-type domain-containing protein n=1 Tax=Zhihengliuella salsuginis TaxID=578222 RepID=A0ABQ3GHZ2_9MICC|nr:helix-turn-helix transcriptional regulator [Zhihengliuella salsuginis]GHD05207.1 hypothetical protein GCM10008096_13810 [Zhihengliuella salsuginis]